MFHIHRAHGFGGIEVYLLGGVHVEGDTAEGMVAYDDLDGLCVALGRAIALRDSDMTGAEARYLRKRLDMSQADLGMLGGKSEQVAAKWEKGRLPVPKAEANLLRLRWLQRYSPAEVGSSVERLTRAHQCKPPRSYSFRFHLGEWSEMQDAVAAIEAHHTGEVIDFSLRVSSASQDGVGYIASEILALCLQDSSSTLVSTNLGAQMRAFA